MRHTYKTETKMRPYRVRAICVCGWESNYHQSAEPLSAHRGAHQAAQRHQIEAEENQ